MYERILVPLDSSKLADVVLPYAEELAGAFNSEATLLYVCEPEEEQYQRVHEFYLGKIAELVKSHIKEHYPRKRGVSVEVKSVVLLGKPSEVISDYANNNDIGLIVIGSRGRFGIMRRFMEEIADKVFQTTTMPLLLTTTTKLHPELGPGQLLNRILLPLDGSERSEASIPYVSELTKKLRAEVTLLQVVAPGQHVHTVGGLNYVRFTEQQVESMKESTRKYLERVGVELARTGAIVQYEVRVGDDTAKEIISIADEIGARLIVIATRRSAGIGRKITGSKTQEILQATNIPVLLMRTRKLKA